MVQNHFLSYQAFCRFDWILTIEWGNVLPQFCAVLRPSCRLDNFFFFFKGWIISWILHLGGLFTRGLIHIAGIVILWIVCVWYHVALISPPHHIVSGCNNKFQQKYIKTHSVGKMAMAICNFGTIFITFSM